MPAFARRFVVVLAAVLLVGCGPEPRPLYTWGDYQPTDYQYDQNEQGGLEEQIAALKRAAARDMQPVRAAGDVGAHGACCFNEADVALDRVQAHTLDLDAILAFRACCKRAKCYEIASR